MTQLMRLMFAVTLLVTPCVFSGCEGDTTAPVETPAEAPADATVDVDVDAAEEPVEEVPAE